MATVDAATTLAVLMRLRSETGPSPGLDRAITAATENVTLERLCHSPRLMDMATTYVARKAYAELSK